MTTVIACMIAGICLVGVVALWFKSAYQALLGKRSSFVDLQAQMRLHQRLYRQVQGGPDEKTAARMLDTSRMLCHEAAKEGYNVVLHKPVNRIPALLMGFRAVDETE